MARGKAEDAGGLTPAKDNNAAPYHFDSRTLPIFKCVDYKGQLVPVSPLQQDFPAGHLEKAAPAQPQGNRRRYAGRNLLFKKMYAPFKSGNPKRRKGVMRLCQRKQG